MINSDFEKVLSDSFFQAMEETQIFSEIKALEVIPILDEKEIEADYFSMLTVSAADFRVVYNLHYTLNQSIKDVIRGEAAEQLNKEDLIYSDYISEYSNLFCGVFKRKLNTAFTLLGMSTPDVMKRNCMKTRTGSTEKTLLFH